MQRIGGRYIYLCFQQQNQLFRLWKRNKGIRLRNFSRVYQGRICLFHEMNSRIAENTLQDYEKEWTIKMNNDRDFLGKDPLGKLFFESCSSNGGGTID